VRISAMLAGSSSDKDILDAYMRAAEGHWQWGLSSLAAAAAAVADGQIVGDAIDRIEGFEDVAGHHHVTQQLGDLSFADSIGV